MQQTYKLKAAVFGLALATCLPWVARVNGQDAPVLPGGASSLTETYGDWSVACQSGQAAIRCAISQQQVRQDGQRVVTIELQTAPEGALGGNLVLPFGIQIDAGATLRIDEQPATMAPLRFHTCLPAGCVMRVSFDAPTVTLLRAGAELHVETRTADTGQEFVIALSLSGFSSAIDRLKVLTGPWS
jgi:invasion protein IalB